MAIAAAPELFVLPIDDEFLLYAPLRDSVVRVNGEAIEQIAQLPKVEGDLAEFWSNLCERGIVEDSDGPSKSMPIPMRAHTIFKPTVVTLFPTFDCNLRCKYCYSEAGARTEVIDEEIVEAAIATIVRNAVDSKSRSISVAFHGGGEPFYGQGWNRMRLAVELAQAAASQHGLTLHVTSASNGLLSHAQLEWVRRNLSNINLSVDGPPEIQNEQRPTKAGTASSPSVERTIAYFEQHKVKYGIRTTITERSSTRMAEIVAYFRSISSLRSYHFEPLFECGRCRTSGASAPEHPQFAKELLKLMSDKVSEGISIYYSGARGGPATTTFCGALGENFTVTPLGDVTSCHEVSTPGDARSKHFFIGRYESRSKSFVVDEDLRMRLLQRQSPNLSHCRDCFIKYNCAGDCAAKASLVGDLFDASKNSRCDSNRMVSLYRLRRRTGVTSNTVEVESASI